MHYLQNKITSRGETGNFLRCQLQLVFTFKTSINQILKIVEIVFLQNGFFK